MIINSNLKCVLIDLMDVPEHYLYKYTSEPQLLKLLKYGPEHEIYACVLVKNIQRFPEISNNNVYLISSPSVIMRPKCMSDLRDFKEQLSDIMNEHSELKQIRHTA